LFSSGLARALIEKEKTYDIALKFYDRFVKECRALDVVVKAEGEMREQLKSLQSEVAQLTSTLDMIPGGFGPRRPSKEAKKSVLAATKKIAKEYVAEK
jgi:uncharacterized membrane protein